jgi:hypothetical protein
MGREVIGDRIEELQEFRSYRSRRVLLVLNKWGRQNRIDEASRDIRNSGILTWTFQELFVVGEASRLTLPSSNLGLSSAVKPGGLPMEEGKAGRLTYHPTIRHSATPELL